MAEASQPPSLVNVNDNGVGLTLRLIIIAESSVVANPPRQRWKRWARDTPMLHVPRERHTVRRAIHEASQHGVDVVIFRPPPSSWFISSSSLPQLRCPISCVPNPCHYAVDRATSLLSTLLAVRDASKSRCDSQQSPMSVSSRTRGATRCYQQ